jgi:hypothetical protein
MTTKWKRNLLIILVLMTLVTPCSANPMDPTPFFALAILVESSIVALLVASIGLDFIRMLYTWSGITIVTWILMIASLVAINRLISVRWAYYDVASVAVPLLAEGIVVLGEAWLLVLLSRRSFFRKPETKRLSWGKAVIISVVANMGSLLTGFV